MDKIVFLVRHGLIDTGTDKRYIGGDTDLPLTLAGIEQAKKVRDYFEESLLFKDDLTDVCYTSPLVRCRQTAEIILENTPLTSIVDEELIEINLGQWEYKTFDEIKKADPKGFIDRGKDLWGFVPPGGESFQALSRRVMRAFSRMIEGKAKHILAVAHAGVNRVIIQQLTGMAPDTLFDIEQPYGGVCELTKAGNKENWDYRRII